MCRGTAKKRGGSRVWGKERDRVNVKGRMIPWTKSLPATRHRVSQSLQAKVIHDCKSSRFWNLEGRRVKPNGRALNSDSAGSGSSLTVDD